MACVTAVAVRTSTTIRLAHILPRFFVFVPVGALHLWAGVGYDETRWPAALARQAAACPPSAAMLRRRAAMACFWLGLPARHVD